MNDQNSTENLPDPRVELERLVSRRIAEDLQQEGHKREHNLYQLLDAGRDDATVSAFLEAWKQGGFFSFEAMVCQMAVALAKEKKMLFETVVDAMNKRPADRITIRG